MSFLIRGELAVNKCKRGLRMFAYEQRFEKLVDFGSVQRSLRVEANSCHSSRQVLLEAELALGIRLVVNLARLWNFLDGRLSLQRIMACK